MQLMVIKSVAMAILGLGSLIIGDKYEIQATGSP